MEKAKLQVVVVEGGADYDGLNVYEAKKVGEEYEAGALVDQFAYEPHGYNGIDGETDDQVLERIKSFGNGRYEIVEYSNGDQTFRGDQI